MLGGKAKAGGAEGRRRTESALRGWNAAAAEVLGFIAPRRVASSASAHGPHMWRDEPRAAWLVDRLRRAGPVTARDNRLASPSSFRGLRATTCDPACGIRPLRCQKYRGSGGGDIAESSYGLGKMPLPAPSRPIGRRAGDVLAR